MKGYAGLIRRKSGFTLVEMVIVIAIIAALAATAVPAVMNWLPNYRLKKAARELYSNLQLARMTAIRNNAPCAVVFDPAVNPGSYYICTDRGGNGVWDGPAQMGGDDTMLKTIDLVAYNSGIDYGNGNAAAPIAGGFDNGITFASAGNDVAVFSNRGILEPPSGYVYLQNNEGSAFGVGVLTSGVINLQRWYQASANWD